MDVVALLFGGIVLYLGAEWLVKGSAGLARSLGVRPLVIGLTVVAYGTSAPELAVSTAAILEDSSAIVLGNILGSNIANLALILGLTALIAPPAVDGQLIRREVPVLCISVGAVPLVLANGTITFIESALLLLGAIGFTAYTLLASAPGGRAGSEMGRAETESTETASEPPEQQSRLRMIIITFVGLALLVFGGNMFVSGAQGLAHTLGMSERLVGLTVVAIGTSLPELAASLVAAARGYSSLAVGNVIGSNIFNVFMILGVVGLVRPIHGNLDALAVDVGFMVGTTLLAVMFMRGARHINRVEGTLLLASYVAFIVTAALDW